MKKKIIFLIVVLLNLVFVLASFGDWIIEGDNVYVNDSNVFINANPHTLYQDGFVYYNLTSKTYTGDIDMVFGFDVNRTKPVSIELYKPINVTFTNSYTCVDYFNYTTNPKYFWCWSNITNNQTNETYLELEFEHSFDWGNVSNKTAYWDYNKTKEWKDFSSNFQRHFLNYQDMNVWYLYKNVPIVADEEYYFRIKLDMLPHYTEDGSKYWFAIKPSGESLIQAIASGHLYALDPWWNSTYQNKMNITNLTDPITLQPREYVRINLTYKNGMQNDFGDVRFVNLSENEELNYSIDFKRDGTYAIFRIDTNNYSSVRAYWNTSTTFVTTSNFSSLYENHLVAGYLFDNTTGNLTEITGLTTARPVSNPTRTGSGWFNKSINFEDTNSEYVDTDASLITGSKNRTIIAWINPESCDSTYDSIITWGQSAVGQANRFGLGNSSCALEWSVEGATYTSGLKATIGSWSFVGLSGNNTNMGNYTLYVNGSSDLSLGEDISISTSSGEAHIGHANFNPNGFFDGFIDELFVFDDYRTVAQLDDYYKIIIPNHVLSSVESRNTVSPKVTINAPSGTLSSNNVTLNFTAITDDDLDYCYYNVTTSGGG